MRAAGLQNGRNGSLLGPRITNFVFKLLAVQHIRTIRNSLSRLPARASVLSVFVGPLHARVTRRIS